MKHVLTIAVVGGLWLGAVARSQAQDPPAIEDRPPGGPAAGMPALGPAGSFDLGLPKGALYGSPPRTSTVDMRMAVNVNNPYSYGVAPFGAPGVTLNDTINCGGIVPPRLVCVGYPPGPVYCGPQYQCLPRAPFRCNYRIAFGGILPCP